MLQAESTSELNNYNSIPKRQRKWEKTAPNAWFYITRSPHATYIPRELFQPLPKPCGHGCLALCLAHPTPHTRLQGGGGWGLGRTLLGTLNAPNVSGTAEDFTPETADDFTAFIKNSPLTLPHASCTPSPLSCKRLLPRIPQIRLSRTGPLHMLSPLLKEVHSRPHRD